MSFADADGKYLDREIVCRDCKKPFVWEAGEQMFFDSKQLTYAPTRCKPCREINKARGSQSNKAAPQPPQQPAQGEHERARNFWQDDEDRGDRRGRRR